MTGCYVTRPGPRKRDLSLFPEAAPGEEVSHGAAAALSTPPRGLLTQLFPRPGTRCAHLSREKRLLIVLKKSNTFY